MCNVESIDGAIKKLILYTPEKLIEPSIWYKEQNNSDTNNISTFCSDDTQGDLIHAKNTGQGNFIIRGYKSLVRKSKVSFTGKNNIVFLGPHSRARS